MQFAFQSKQEDQLCYGHGEIQTDLEIKVVVFKIPQQGVNYPLVICTSNLRVLWDGSLVEGCQICLVLKVLQGPHARGEGSFWLSMSLNIIRRNDKELGGRCNIQ